MLGDLKYGYITDGNNCGASGVLLDDSHLTEILALLEDCDTERITLSVVGINACLTAKYLEKTVTDVAFLNDYLALAKSLLCQTHVANPFPDFNSYAGRAPLRPTAQHINYNRFGKNFLYPEAGLTNI